MLRNAGLVLTCLAASLVSGMPTGADEGTLDMPPTTTATTSSSQTSSSAPPPSPTVSVVAWSGSQCGADGGAENPSTGSKGLDAQQHQGQARPMQCLTFPEGSGSLKVWFPNGGSCGANRFSSADCSDPLAFTPPGGTAVDSGLTEDDVECVPAGFQSVSFGCDLDFGDAAAPGTGPMAAMAA